MLFLENKSGGVRVLNIPIFSLLLRIEKNTERHTPERESVCSCSVASVVSNSFVTLWTLAHQAPLSMGFSRQEYWSGFAMPSSRGSSWPRNPVSCIAGILYCWATGEARKGVALFFFFFITHSCFDCLVRTDLSLLWLATITEVTPRWGYHRIHHPGARTSLDNHFGSGNTGFKPSASPEMSRGKQRGFLKVKQRTCQSSNPNKKWEAGLN